MYLIKNIQINTFGEDKYAERIEFTSANLDSEQQKVLEII